jgi:hypothetical protein
MLDGVVFLICLLDTILVFLFFLAVFLVGLLVFAHTTNRIPGAAAKTDVSDSGIQDCAVRGCSI